MVAPIADCRLALRTLLAPFGPAALTNGGSLGAARPCGTWSSSDPEGSRIGMRVVLAIPRIWRITGPLTHPSATCLPIGTHVRFWHPIRLLVSASARTEALELTRRRDVLAISSETCISSSVSA